MRGAICPLRHTIKGLAPVCERHAGARPPIHPSRRDRVLNEQAANMLREDVTNE